jgi:uncharacterized membrane protein YbaN (DUF454 family)
VGAGTIGIVVPGWPTTVFFILALWAFKRSSPRLETWLLNHRVIGSTLREWDEHRVVRPRTKVIAITTLWLMIAVSLLLLTSSWVKALLVVIAVCVTVYLATRKSNLES